MGSESVSGTVYLLDLSEPLTFGPTFPVHEFCEVASFEQTLWAVDGDPKGRFAAIGKCFCFYAFFHMLTMSCRSHAAFAFPCRSVHFYKFLEYAKMSCSALYC